MKQTLSPLHLHSAVPTCALPSGVPFLEAAAEIHKEHGVTLLAVQTSAWVGARLCPAGLVDGHLHVLSEGDVVMALGHDAHAVLRAVDSESNLPNAWRQRFHSMRKAATLAGGRRAYVFSSVTTFVSRPKVYSPNGKETSARSTLQRTSSSTRGADEKSSASPETSTSTTPSGTGGDDVVTVEEGRDGEKAGSKSEPLYQSKDFRKSQLKSVSKKTRNLCVLTTKLSAAAVVRDASALLKKRRQEGREESTFSSWLIISRIAKMGNHILIIVDGELDKERWEELSTLFYRMRGNDGCNMKPIVVVSKTPPSLQQLTVWRSIEVYVTKGSISDKATVRHLVGNTRFSLVSDSFVSSSFHLHWGVGCEGGRWGRVMS